MDSNDKNNEQTHGGREISAGGVIFKKTTAGIEVALISTMGGKRWGLPKGLQEDHETLARTAHREVKEETGLEGHILKLLDRLEYFYTFTDARESKRVFKLVYFFLMEYTSGNTGVGSTVFCRTQRAEKRLAARRMSAGLAKANSSESNTADDRLSARPKGVPQIDQCRVADTRNMSNITAYRRLVLGDLQNSETGQHTVDPTQDHDDEVDECRWFPIIEAVSLLKFADEKALVEKAKESIDKL